MSGKLTPSAISFYPGMVKICPCCKQKIKKLNPHRVCRQKVALLRLLAKLWDEGSDWVRVEEGRGVVDEKGTKHTTAYCARQHADRLVWFGLVNHRGKRTGEYQINEDGFRFLANALKVPAVIWCRDGEVIETDARLVGINEVKGVVLDKEYWDEYPRFQRYAISEVSNQAAGR